MNRSTTKNPMRWLDPSWQQALKTPLVVGLGALLALQLVMALLVGGGGGMAPMAADTPLFAFDPDSVTGIEIQVGDGGETLRLARTGEGWTLPGLDNFPASDSRVAQLLDTLAGLTRPLPVATTVAAQGRFKVSDDRFERRLFLRGRDGDLGTLTLGDSPGFRRLFARVDDEPAVYDLRLAQSDLSAGVDDWIDRGRLRLDRADIQRIAGPGWTLVKGDEGWRLDGSDAAPDTKALNGLLDQIASLGYHSVLGTEAAPRFGLEAPALTLEIGLAGGATRDYRIGRMAQSDDFVLKEAGDPYYYRLSAFDLGDLLDLTAARLLGTVPAGPGDDTANESAPAPTAEAAPAPTAEPTPVPTAETAPAPVEEVAPAPTAEPTPAPEEEAAPAPAAETVPAAPAAGTAPAPTAEAAPAPVGSAAAQPPAEMRDTEDANTASATGAGAESRQ